MNLPAKVGVTAYLHIDYRAPTKADQVNLFQFPSANLLADLIQKSSSLSKLDLRR